jgi:hypothetical protein
MTRRTAMTILATQKRKLISPIPAPWPQGSQTLVTKADITSMTRIMMACAVPLSCPHPITIPNATLVAKRREAKSWEPCR